MYSYISSLFSTVIGAVYGNSNRKKDASNSHGQVKPKINCNAWRKVGKVDCIFMYPLLYGEKKVVTVCRFYSNEVVGCENGYLIQNQLV